MNDLTILQLTAENVKRLHAVDIKPDGSLVIIGGRNAQGKSSVLDSIEFALGGDPSAKMPVRRGEANARVVVNLGEIVVKRTFTAAGGTSLVVTNADGQKQSSPQTILDKLTGALTFDPLAFSRQKPAAQAETLRALVGLDFTKETLETERLYNERTAVNREAKALEARMAALPHHTEVPKEETSATAILEEQAKAASTNKANAAARSQAQQDDLFFRQCLSIVASTNVEIEKTEKEIARLQNVLEGLKSAVERQTQKVKDAKIKADASEFDASKLVDIDLTTFATKLTAVEQVNRKVRDNKLRAEVVAQFKAKTEQAEQLTLKLSKLDADKRAKINTAKYPIEGLAFDTAGGITMAGIPFEQCSSAEQLRVSVAIGLALHPKLRVLLIRDGSLLDSDSLDTIAAMAQEAKAQLWIERVGTDGQTSVVIEDGQVVEPKELF